MAALPLIELDGVTKSFDGGRTLVLHEVTLQIATGSFVCLIGGSGSGKTTTMKMMNRLLEPSRGAVRFDGTPVDHYDAPTLRRRIGYVFQEVGLFPHMTIAENIGITPQLLGWKRDEIAARVAELIDLVGLPASFGARFPGALSGGQRQRVGVARALAARPRAMLMDEPFGALDPVTRSEIQSEFKRLQQRLRKTVVFVTHDVSEALLLGDRIALIEDGALRGVYAPQQFLTSADEHAQAYAQTFRAIQQIQA
jgi:osmoprotectant transport system ATP-binding protein